jgi:hypothetical protein
LISSRAKGQQRHRDIAARGLYIFRHGEKPIREKKRGKEEKNFLAETTIFSCTPHQDLLSDPLDIFLVKSSGLLMGSPVQWWDAPL